MNWLVITAHTGVFIALLWSLRVSRRWPLLFALLTLPGTTIHELLHFLAGLLTGARPVALSVLPQRHGDRWVLGHVLFARLRWWNKLPVALAPLAVVPLGLWLQWNSLFLPWPSWSALGWQFVALQCLVPSWPSERDWRHAFSALTVSALLIASFAAISYKLGYRLVF